LNNIIIVILPDRSWNKKTGCCSPDATTSKENAEVMSSLKCQPTKKAQMRKKPLTAR